MYNNNFKLHAAFRLIGTSNSTESLLENLRELVLPTYKIMM